MNSVPVNINLYPTGVPYFTPNSTEPSLSFYPCQGARGCAVVCPGGGYGGLAVDHEGEQIAAAYNSSGFAVYILRYRVTGDVEQPPLHPAPLCDALHAIAYARSHAAEYGYDADKIAVLGFSAGGHLAVSAAENFDYFDEDEDVYIDPILARPDALVACYAVATLGMYTHESSRHNLIGDDSENPLLASLSGEVAARCDMPPAFIWHTADDNAVPVENALLLAGAMRRVRVPFELHVYPHGPHGLGLAKGYADVSGWFDLSVKFLRKVWEIAV